MGLYDTMQQGKVQSGLGPAQPVNGTSAQKDAWQQKQQMKANPIMKGKPNMNAGTMNNMAQGVGNFASAMGQLKGAQGQTNVGMTGSQNMMKNKQVAQANQTNAAPGGSGAIGGSYGQLVGARPELADYRNTGQAAGQDMSWMDKPGALTMPPNRIYGSTPEQPQSGLQDVASQRQQEQLQAAQSPMQAAAEQMRDYEGPDLGSQDPRELARMGQLRGSLNAPPFTGENPGSNSFQSMLQNAGGQRPDVMPRAGLGPSYMGADQVNPAAPVVMDENGLEPRRGAR